MFASKCFLMANRWQRARGFNCFTRDRVELHFYSYFCFFLSIVCVYSTEYFFQTFPTHSLPVDMAVLMWDIIVSLTLLISPASLSADKSGFRKLYVLQPGPSGTDGVHVSSISSLSGASGQPHSYNVELKASFGGQVRTRRMGHQSNPSIPIRQDAPGRHTTSHHMKMSG